LNFDERKNSLKEIANSKGYSERFEKSIDEIPKKMKKSPISWIKTRTMSKTRGNRYKRAKKRTRSISIDQKNLKNNFSPLNKTVEISGIFGQKYSDSGKKSKEMEIDFRERVKNKLKMKKIEKKNGNSGHKGMTRNEFEKELIDYLVTGSYEYSVEEYDEQVHNLEKFLTEEKNAIEIIGSDDNYEEISQQNRIFGDNNQNFDQEEDQIFKKDTKTLENLEFKKSQKIENLFKKKNSRRAQNQRNIIGENGILNYSPINSTDKQKNHQNSQNQKKSKNGHRRTKSGSAAQSGDWLGLNDSRNALLQDRGSRSFLKTTTPSSIQMSYVNVITPADLSLTDNGVEDRSQDISILGGCRDFGGSGKFEKKYCEGFDGKKYLREFGDGGKGKESFEEDNRYFREKDFYLRYENVFSELNFLEFQKDYKPKTWTLGKNFEFNF